MERDSGNGRTSRLQVDLQSFVRRGAGDAVRCQPLAGYVLERVQRVVVAAGVVVEQDQVAHTGFDGQVARIDDRRVAPAPLERQVIGVILGVVDEHVGTRAELDHVAEGHLVGVGRTQLVVRHKHHRALAVLQPVAVRAAGVVDALPRDLESSLAQKREHVALDAVDHAGHLFGPQREVEAVEVLE